ncbi:B3 domain-containing protein At2g33720-like [Prosopis cineraria]|uniref:B3 domain-containing protein At2g33720-like n=1 Tax=Prosopis cineraria TaxID=364024 RepID=UPI00240FD93C|nr:B3 domain-containing protein At2g33720-like [Prosopis cineraria]
MENNYPPHRQQPRDLFNVFSGNHISTGLQEPTSSSSPNLMLRTELSLSSTFSFTKTRASKHTHRNFSSGNRIKRNSSKPSYYNHCHTEKEKTSNHESNISTALKLYDDPWKIKKVLTASDLGKLNRLLLGSDSMEDLVVSVLGNDSDVDDEELLFKKGMAVRVWDAETESMHELILKRWASFKNCVLIGDWNQGFVKRRALKKGDEIGLQWDPYNFCFNFSILKRVLG